MLINTWPKHCDNEYRKQGYWGEIYVKQLFESKGYYVFMNPDPFGGWDLIVIEPKSGKSKSVQVKTICRYVSKNYFGISDGVAGETIENLLNCDVLILVVRNPFSIDDKEYKGKVLRVINHKNFTKTGNQYIIPSISENFIQIAQLTDEELNQVSSFRTNKS